LRKFFLSLLAAAFLIVLIYNLGLRFELIHSIPSFFYQTLILITIGTGVIFRYLDRTSTNNFTQFYLFSIVLKLMAYLTYLIIVVMTDVPGGPANIVAFISIYLIFTVLEVAFLYAKINR
jgi:hypothetical protein